MPEHVGVRELRQNLSKYLDRVKGGEGLIVTERGREVARLIPSGPGITAYDQRLVLEFGARLATRDLLDVIDGLDRSGPRMTDEEIEAAIDDVRRELF